MCRMRMRPHEGRKIDLIKMNPDVGFEMDTNYKLTEADIACDHL